MPILQVLIFAIGLKLGIVNYEIENPSECHQWLHQNASYLSNDSCIYTKASCHFINEIHDEDALKVFYKSFEDAYADAKKGKLSGVIVLAANFSESKMEQSTSMYDLDSSASNDDSGHIQIYMDQSQLQTTTFLQYRIFLAYKRFNKKLLNGCELNEKFEELPIVFKKPIYGSFMNDFKQTMAPIMFLQLSHFKALIP